MILYHGSNRVIETPDISFSRSNTDFGRGFYTTPVREQAFRWASRYKRKGDSAIVTIYDCDNTLLENGPSVKRFSGYTEEWLDYIVACRSGQPVQGYDIVVGGVANDKVFDTIELYLQQLIDKQAAIGRLQYERPNLQVCFCSQDVIRKHLIFLGSEEL
ncbi:DUF3990 domain-containing protein [Anaerovorax odorimutans]|uniref:DUF3990 domain-containing protein n=1 Tax=Anaerovorax odorimutans TaxID=109327 RepID=A0ABT1RLB3_9FIRM|nr:DUF3990 domain-containing protein [Anaerovorax odorimutans]MCQ4635977.1 DUF3990 domain-containing protein [Anaerovorax odorimutans]